jgi:transposase
MGVEEAVTHFGTCVTTGYHWVRHWNSEGLERLRPKKSPERSPKSDEEMLRRLKRTLEIRPYWNETVLKIGFEVLAVLRQK